jgi:hypothetical protein
MAETQIYELQAKVNFVVFLVGSCLFQVEVIDNLTVMYQLQSVRSNQ